MLQGWYGALQEWDGVLHRWDGVWGAARLVYGVLHGWSVGVAMME